MNSVYAVHNSGGRILRIVNCNPEDAELQAEGSEHVLPCESAGATDMTHYVASGQIAAKANFNFPESLQIIANGIDEATITGIPAGVTVEWPDGQTDEVTDSEVRFSVDLPGTYTLTFDAIPYLRQEVTIEAVPAT